MNPEFIGFAAGFLTSVNLFPQIVRSVKTKSVGDVSLWMLLIYDAGLGLWVLYGLLIQRLPIVVMDGTAFLASLIMTYIKLRFN